MQVPLRRARRKYERNVENYPRNHRLNQNTQYCILPSIRTVKTLIPHGCSLLKVCNSSAWLYERAALRHRRNTPVHGYSLVRRASLTRPARTSLRRRGRALPVPITGSQSILLCLHQRGLLRTALRNSGHSSGIRTAVRTTCS